MSRKKASSRHRAAVFRWRRSGWCEARTTAPCWACLRRARTVAGPVADFIAMRDGKIASVQGCFDSRAVPDQVDMAVVRNRGLQHYPDRGTVGRRGETVGRVVTGIAPYHRHGVGRHGSIEENDARGRRRCVRRYVACVPGILVTVSEAAGRNRRPARKTRPCLRRPPLLHWGRAPRRRARPAMCPGPGPSPETSMSPNLRP
jgi:hypothetical protein